MGKCQNCKFYEEMGTNKFCNGYNEYYLEETGLGNFKINKNRLEEIFPELPVDKWSICSIHKKIHLTDSDMNELKYHPNINCDCIMFKKSKILTDMFKKSKILTMFLYIKNMFKSITFCEFLILDCLVMLVLCMGIAIIIDEGMVEYKKVLTNSKILIYDPVFNGNEFIYKNVKKIESDHIVIYSDQEEIRKISMINYDGELGTWKWRMNDGLIFHFKKGENIFKHKPDSFIKNTEVNTNE